ncbi:hypothetical protein ACXYTJ_06035 [Gilvimarinus sp. F26214L]|uniref:hypothetical protein n=1 Tax=Gilvimarinus sp. DZF01 TaxID=3461371 RepID=UPI004045C0BC
MKINTMQTVLLFAVVPGLNGAALARDVPPQFQGEWNRTIADCGTGRNASRLRIGSNWIAFYESRGVIEVFATQGDEELALIAQLEGEGERWSSFRHFRLSEQGEQLTDITYGADFVRYRCPEADAGTGE